jgi:hypothetical protein
MIERQIFNRTGIALAMLAAVGCMRTASEGNSALNQVGSAGAGRDGVAASRAGNAAAQGGASGSARGAGAPAAGSGTPLAAPAPELCVGEAEAPAIACLADDVGEPNEPMHPVPLPVEPGCGYVVANVSRDDEDAYSFTTTKSDPVSVQLVANGASAGALKLEIRDATASLQDSEIGSTTDASADLLAIIQTHANAPYEVQVTNLISTEACQSYALRVDPSFCTDQYEDNDDVKSATKLTWDASQRSTAKGTLHMQDDDFFEIKTSRADPVRLEGTYTAAADSTVQLKHTIRDASGGLLESEVSARKTDSASFATWLPAPAPGTILRTELNALGDGCASYELTFDAAACTDDFEDNDSEKQTAPLATGTTIHATIHASDDDYFEFAELTSGTCSVTYDVAPGEPQSLKLIIRDAAGGLVASDNGGELSGTTRTLSVGWKTQKATRLQLVALQSGSCQKYQLRCDAGSSSM